MPVTSFATIPGPMKGCSSSRSYMFMCALFQVVDILSICYELDLISNTNWTVSKLGTCTVNVLCHLQVKYYIVKVFIAEFNPLIIFTNHLYIYMNFSFCFDWQTPSILDTPWIDTDYERFNFLPVWNVNWKLCSTEK